MSNYRIRAQLKNKLLYQSLKDCWRERLGFKMRKPFNIMFTVYSTTYVTANIAEQICKDAGIDHKLPTCIATSIVNIVGIAWKDIRFANFTQKVPTAFSPNSYALFALRDGITISSSFVYKHDVADYLQEKAPSIFKSKNTAELFSSFVVPMLAQLISSPLHILALDTCARSDASFIDHLRQISLSYRSVCVGRLMRIIPAFGIGGVLNDLIKSLEKSTLPTWDEVVTGVTDATPVLSNLIAFDKLK